MRPVTASFYDGKTSARKDVRIHFDAGGRLRITGLEHELAYLLSEVRITPRVANTPRSLYFPDGATCETLENDAIDAILQRQGGGRWQAVLHTLESRMVYVLLLLILTMSTVWAAIEYGIPALAKHVAFALPASVDEALGREGLQVLDDVLLDQTQLDQERQARLRSRFEAMTRDFAEGPTLRLEFRKSPRVGPNAFALPSGIIILTDELVLLSEHPHELTSILAHEIGHIRHRHAIRRLLQDSVTVLLVSSLTGDLASVTALSGALPAMLLEAKYSRAFETEADGFALEYLQAHHIPPRHFADMLMRLEDVSGADDTFHHYLLTHPATRDRVKMFQCNDASGSCE